MKKGRLNVWAQEIAQHVYEALEAQKGNKPEHQMKVNKIIYHFAPAATYNQFLDIKKELKILLEGQDRIEVMEKKFPKQLDLFATEEKVHKK